MYKYILPLLLLAACEKSCFDSNSTQMKYEYKLLQNEVKNKNDQKPFK